MVTYVSKCETLGRLGALKVCGRENYVMIQEVLITSVDTEGRSHIAPMGIHMEQGLFVILPFKPSVTLDNIVSSGSAVINYCDDVRIFAGCLSGRRQWNLIKTEHVNGYYLEAALAHTELVLDAYIDDPLRPKLLCKVVKSFNHRPFQGFNRAQFAVIEAAILVSRLGRLSWDKIDSELAYLRIGLDKTAGDHEREAWDWLMQIIEDFRGRERTHD